MTTDFNLQNYSDLLNSFKQNWGDYSNNYQSLIEKDEGEEEKAQYNLQEKQIFDTINDYLNWFELNNPLRLGTTRSSFSGRSNLVDDSAIDIEELLKNSTVKVKRGVNISKLSSELVGLIQLLDKYGAEVTITSAYRPGSTTSSGASSRHSKGQAIDIVPTNRKDYTQLNALLGNQEIQDYLESAKLGVLNETSEEIQQKTGATGPHYHIGSDMYGKDIAMKFNVQ